MESLRGRELGALDEVDHPPSNPRGARAANEPWTLMEEGVSAAALEEEVACVWLLEWLLLEWITELLGVTANAWEVAGDGAETSVPFLTESGLQVRVLRARAREPDIA